MAERDEDVLQLLNTADAHRATRQVLEREELELLLAQLPVWRLTLESDLGAQHEVLAIRDPLGLLARAWLRVAHHTTSVLRYELVAESFHLSLEHYRAPWRGRRK